MSITTMPLETAEQMLTAHLVGAITARIKSDMHRLIDPQIHSLAAEAAEKLCHEASVVFQQDHQRQQLQVIVMFGDKQHGAS